MITASHKLSNVQLELLKVFSYQVTEQELLDIKDLLARYFAQRATNSMQEFWESHKLDDDTIDAWLTEHERIPYT